MASSVTVAAVLSLAVTPSLVSAQGTDASSPSGPVPTITWQYGGFVDLGRLFSSTSPSNRLFRNRGTTPRVDEWDLNMTGAYLRKAPSESSRTGVELTVQEGRDSEIF